MRFAVDAHAIGRRLTGNEVYIRSLLNAFAPLEREAAFIAYICADEAKQWVPARFRARRIAANPVLRLGFDLARKLRQDRPDLIHVQYTAPLACPAPVVVSVHDISFLEYPEFFRPARAMQLRWSVRRTVRAARRVLTVSEFSRASILKAYGDLDPDKVVVVPNAAAAGFHPLPHGAATAAVTARFGIDKPFIFSVGDLQPRKNHIRLIAAFAELVRAYPGIRHDLVLAGQGGWFAPRVREAAQRSGVPDRIHFPGFVSDDDLLQLYNACEFFIFPSLYEGFGLPVLEAMACGRAVACANTSALPEVVAGAGLLFDPHSVEQIARTMIDLVQDPELRARTERLGLHRSSRFSWQESARRTLKVYYEVAERRFQTHDLQVR